MIRSFSCIKGKGQLLKCALLIVFFFLSNFIRSQCTGCGTVISSNTSANITLNTGDILCINNGVTHSGNIILNGGTLCNEGTVTNVTLNGGTFNNYGNFNRTGALNIANSENVVIHCYNGSEINISGAYNQTSADADDHLSMIVDKGSKFMVGGNFNHNKGNLSISLGLPVSAGLPATFSVSGSFNVSSAGFSLVTAMNSTFGIGANMNLDAKYNKSISNSGEFVVAGSFNVSGNGLGTYSTTMVNSGTISIASFVNFSYSNGTASLLNNSGKVFTIGKSMTLAKDNNAFTNNGTLNASLDITLEKGSATNSGTVTARDLVIRKGTLTNSNTLKSTRDLLLDNIDAVVNNNGYISVIRDFQNKGALNMSPGSMLFTTNYYNSNNASVNGPATIANDAELARIMIEGNSENSWNVTGELLIYDQSLTSTSNNANFGFDVVSNSNQISSSVKFVAAAAPSGNGPSNVNCANATQMYFLNVGANLLSTCAGSAIPVTAQLQHTIQAGPNTLTVNSNVPSSSYTWQPGNLNSQNTTLFPNSSTTYTCYVKLNNGCIVSNTLLITVNPQPLPTIAYVGSPFTYLAPSNLTFPVTLTGQTGGVYSAIPAGLNIDANTGLISANGSNFGTYTVTYTAPETQYYCYPGYEAKTVVTLVNALLQCNNVTVNFVDGILEPELCPGDKIQVITLGGASNYAWSPATGLSCTNCPNPVLTFSPPTVVYSLTYTYNNISCPAKFLSTIFEKQDCADNSILGCCFSNYGVSVFVDKSVTNLNVYCNLVNEIANLVLPITVSKGQFESTGNINLTKDWFHNGLNNLFEIPYALSLDPLSVRQGTTTFMASWDENIKGNSSTFYNKLVLAGNGKRTIWINTLASSDLDLTTNEFVLQSHYFLMKNELSNIYRISGFASSSKTGYFSRKIAGSAAALYKTYLFPLGTGASISTPFRYRPVEVMNNKTSTGDEISANFNNTAPSLLSDVDFANVDQNVTNNVTDKSPSVLYYNGLYYHKVKNTVPNSPVSYIVLRAYFPAIDGNYNSLSEWQPGITAQDWWSITPGVFSNYGVSSSPGTFGQVYAASNGTLTFNGKPFSIASTALSINTSSLGSPNNIITLSSAPSPGSSSNSNTTSVTNINNVTTTLINNVATDVLGNGVSTSTTNSSNGAVTINTTVLNSGVTSNTNVITGGPNPGVQTSTTSTGLGGVITNTTVFSTNTNTTVTTSTVGPTIGGSSASTIITVITPGPITTTSLITITNNANSSTSQYTITTVTQAGTSVNNQTCVTVASGTNQVVTCNQTNPVNVTTNTIATNAPNLAPVSTATNIYNNGPIQTNPNPLAADYFLTINTANNCDLPGKIKFTVASSTTIFPNSVEFYDFSTNTSLGNLSPSLFVITNPTLGINLNSTPAELLASCSNSIEVKTAINNDFIISTGTDILTVNIPALIGGFTVSNFDIYDYQNALADSQTLTINNNNTINTGLLLPGVYSFEFTLTLGATNHLIKGQFIKL